MSRLLMFLLLVGLMATTTLASASSGQDQPDFQGPPPDPASLYAENCASCHGERGEGRVGPAFVLLDDHSDDEIYHTIAEGRPERGMPAWEARLTPEEISALVGYLRTLAAQAQPPAEEEPAPAHAAGADLRLVLTLQEDQVVAHASLRDEQGQPMAGEKVAFALRTTLGGKLNLGTFVTDEEGVATLRYPAGEVPSLTLEASYPPEAGDPIRAVASIDLPAGQEIPPVATGLFSPNPPPIAILLLGLVVGGVWITYVWVAFQLLRILRVR
ncbi:MAG: c-type cytochrome [Chloroflexi bacterium]|nr:c-type cytochrome [Chloroflexota bacterium]